ncbi:GH3 auxin-responsive promoter-domain-containing protein [Boletus edulis BED1]|uniref:GH3 auxin-responsive promoter-domain-containing protein n=1 Tax=Boletus edulis BED1 TaxID=1328754 RepID=A0AAD4BYW0_BOLED|nr:GH3 auxin-responsive promoter-domain-containing protein [Boletus edulis BED1]
MTSSSIPGTIPAALTPELLDRLRERVHNTLLYIISKNKHTRYVRESPVFNDFRSTLDALGDSNDVVHDDTLLETFRAAIPLTSYDSYEPFLNKLVAPNPNVNDVKDMFSPGLPYFIACSSATSGKKGKLFAKYNHAARSSLQVVDEHANPVSAQGGKNCIVYSLTYREIIQVTDDDGVSVARFPISSMSGGVIRMKNGIHVDRDPFWMTLTAPRATSPLAASFIVNYRSFLLVHLVFALADPQLETINTLFGYMFVDMMRCMEEEWDTLVHSIETGVLPDWEGTSHVQQYLEPKFSARPERAAHLRTVGKVTEPGWLKKLWPGLNVVISIASGAFALVVPKMRHYLGPDVRMTSLGFTASEAYIGTAYSLTELNLFKATSDDIIEYLDLSCPETASNLAFASPRAMACGDIVEIVGFDSIDGSPILRYAERRGTVVRLQGALISEEELTGAIFSAQDHFSSRSTGNSEIVPSYVKTTDIYYPPPLLNDGTATSAHQALARVEAALCSSNELVRRVMNSKRLASPTIHILKPGTFREYRALKIKAAITGTGQIKVPTVLWDHEIQEWMLQRVERVVVRQDE